MNSAHVRITHGPLFDACQLFWTKRQAANEAANALALEFGCLPGRKLSRGARVEGLYLPIASSVPTGWSVAGKPFPGYIKPNKRTLAGRAAAAKLEAIKLPTEEDLAHALGFPPFFTEPGGDKYCSAAGSVMCGGVYYVEFPAVLSHCFSTKGVPEGKAGIRVPQTKAGVEFIKEWQYMKAQEES